jgi:hypothetical protein
MTTPTIIHFDGGARPSNPGPAAIGRTIEAEDWSDEGSDHLGKATNNDVEYRASSTSKRNFFIITEW